MVTGPGNVYVDRGQAPAARPDRHRLRGRARPRSPILADDTADPAHVAADLISQAEHDPLAGAVLVTDSEALADAVARAGARPGRGDQARRADHHRARRQPVGHRAGRRPRRRAARSSTPTPPSTWRSRPGTPRDGRRAGAQRRRDLRRRRGRRCRSATTAPAPTTCCPPAAAPGTPAGCRCRRSCAASTSSTTTEQALARGRRARRRPGRRRGPARARAPPSAIRQR